jgi:hypothetical protein
VTGRPIYCGYGVDGRACTELAGWRVTAKGYAAVACHGHLAAEKRAAGVGGRTFTVERVGQPDGAVRGDGQGALFDLPAPIGGRP